MNGLVPKQTLWTKARFGEDVIIANLDSGVWPESESFRDEGMGPIPTAWKGICQNEHDQRKLIGARYFHKGREAIAGPLNSTSSNSPRDTGGHGTHTLSIAGGAFAPSAAAFISFAGGGSAKGGAPRARVAAYKVCWPEAESGLLTCSSADILAGILSAVRDGADVISISASTSPTEVASLADDVIAVGSFRAVKNGIAVVASAGNLGPMAGTVANNAPWVITVAASAMDRDWASYVCFNEDQCLKNMGKTHGSTTKPSTLIVLVGGENIKGSNVAQYKSDWTLISPKGKSYSLDSLPKGKLYPFISSKEAKSANASSEQAKYCMVGSLHPKKVKGKIVVCTRGNSAVVEKGEAVKLAGGAGMVLVNNATTGDDLTAFFHVLPATHISYSDGLKLLSYIQSNELPVGCILPPKVELHKRPSPVMADFSSQGPNKITPEILKPDITAPGVNIVAAFTEGVGSTGYDFDMRRFPFYVQSGTSMSCPHVSGIVALLKNVHPDWSPSAIKSAIMTTARVQDNKGESIKNTSLAKATPFNYGSGHVWPNRAMDPGLIYDTNITDYLNFLCAIGYNSSQIAVFEFYSCPSNPPAPEDLNYPSITVPNLGSGSITVTRRVKNVGAPSTYMARVRSPKGVSVLVDPERITFEKIDEEKVFQIVLRQKVRKPIKDYAFGSLTWYDGKHLVRSPIVVKS
ncbi:Subtilisin-like protease [Apostasia shenzhenica]|uniref:Subtilisin-like protease n=1 Tax=Apostasia shenzhenica TaxID=1088818 RepID=A0A2I0ASV2_9ASPA|nr:Subtilisin-like protease [Apostasia shenzhenica]